MRRTINYFKTENEHINYDYEFLSQYFYFFLSSVHAIIIITWCIVFGAPRQAAEQLLWKQELLSPLILFSMSEMHSPFNSRLINIYWADNNYDIDPD